MNNIFRFCGFTAVLVFVFSCSLFAQDSAVIKPGVTLTFDDVHNVKNWIKHVDLFKKYNAKATLFINSPQRLSVEDVESLNILREAGFAIGNHGSNHVRSVDYIDQKDVESFLNDEIFPAQEELEQKGFSPKAFAYPMSQNDERTDDALSAVFRHARTGAGIPDGKTLADCDVFFTPVEEVAEKFTLTGKGCDGADDEFLEREIFPALERAKARGEIVTFYSHNVISDAKSHFIRPEILEKVLEKVVELDLAFYTFEELPSVYGDKKRSSENIEPLTIEPKIIFSGFDHRTCRVHARGAKIPGGSAVITSQMLLLSGSDVFYEIESSTSSDDGVSWTPFVKQSGLGRYSPEEGVEVCPCDGVPAWHDRSKTILLTGHLATYEKNAISKWREKKTPDENGLVDSRLWYSVFDETSSSWSDMALLKVPASSAVSGGGAGCSQRFDLNDGTILLPFYAPCDETPGCSQVIVVRCSYDGKELKYIEEGAPLRLNVPRGLGEPSIIEWKGTFFLTLRNDQQGYVAQSSDGLNFDEPKPWRWSEDGELIGNANTQQHWLKNRDGLFLVYTRKTPENEHVFRNRAPLFIAKVDLDKLALIRETEQIVVPERGARLGNFGVTYISEDESWVVVSEWMQSKRGGGEAGVADCMKYGSDNAVWLSKVRR